MALALANKYRLQNVKCTPLNKKSCLQQESNNVVRLLKNVHKMLILRFKKISKLFLISKHVFIFQRHGPEGEGETSHKNAV